MANTAASQMALANDAGFILRVQAALASVAFQVLSENPATVNHPQRVSLAAAVLNNPSGKAAQIAQTLVMRTNVFAFTTSYDFDKRAVVTASGDPDLQSQLMTDWNVYAGITT